MKLNDCGCTMISSLDSKQLLDFLLMVNDVDFIFRDKLVLDSIIKFGNEIEFNSLDLDKAQELVFDFNMQHSLNGSSEYIAKEEMTASGEIVTPILRNRCKTWDDFYDMYGRLKSCGATIGSNTSSHVHIGTDLIETPEDLSLFLKMLVVFEPIIFKFGYGYDDRARDYIRCIGALSNYAMMASPKRYRDFITSLRHYNPNIADEKVKAFLAPTLEFRAAYNFNDFDFNKLKCGFTTGSKHSDHIEIRCFNGTLDPVIAQNNINLITHIIEAIIMRRIDTKYVESEYQKFRKKRYNFDVWRAIIIDEHEGLRYNRLLDGFSEIKMDKALKLADMLFTNDLDKIYFLKQYLKLFNTSQDVVKRLIK